MFRTTAAAALAFVAFGGFPGAAAVAEGDRQRLIAHLDMTAGWLVDEVSGLSAAQIQFRRAPDARTIAEVLEHLVVLAPIYWRICKRRSSSRQAIGSVR